MMGQVQFLSDIVARLQAAGIPYMIAGSMGSSYHGEPRATQDIDVVIDPTVSQLKLFVDAFDASFYVSASAAIEALRFRGMFNVVDTESGWKADFIICKDREFSREEFGRRSDVHLEGISASFVSAEDAILSKLEWIKLGAGDRQLRDAVGVASVQWEKLDRSYLAYWANRLGVADELAHVFQAAEESLSE